MKRKLKKILIFILVILLSLILTYFLSNISGNAIIKTFDTSNMLAFMGFSLAMFVFVNDTVIKLKTSVKSRNSESKKIKQLIIKIEKGHKELSDDLLFLFAMMVVIFIIEILCDILINVNLKLFIWYGSLTVSSILFFFRCMATIYSLYAIFDIFIATMKLNKISTEI